MISSAARSTVNRPRKKSCAFTTREPLRALDVDVGVERQHRRRVVGGRDRRGPGCRRACRDCGPADRRSMPRPRPASGHACCSNADVATSWWTVPAPISIVSPFLRMPDRPGMRAMSISVFGLAQPKLHQRDQTVTAGDELALAIASREASRARRPATWPGCTRMPSKSRPASLDDAPQLFGPKHHVDVFHAELAERIDRRGDDARRRAERAGFAHAFRAQRVHGRRRHGGGELEAREIDGARDARSP